MKSCKNLPISTLFKCKDKMQNKSKHNSQVDFALYNNTNPGNLLSQKTIFLMFFLNFIKLKSDLQNIFIKVY